MQKGLFDFAKGVKDDRDNQDFKITLRYVLYKGDANPKYWDYIKSNVGCGERSVTDDVVYEYKEVSLE